MSKAHLSSPEGDTIDSSLNGKTIEAPSGAVGGASGASETLGTIPHPKRHNLEPFRDSSKTRVLRFWLNILFLVGAVIGLVVYFYTEEKEVAKWILLGSCVFKFVELALRILKI